MLYPPNKILDKVNDRVYLQFFLIFCCHYFVEHTTDGVTKSKNKNMEYVI